MEKREQQSGANLIKKKRKPFVRADAPKTSESKLIGRLEGIVKMSGDIESPIEPPEVWEALK